MSSENISLSIINLRVNKETALAANQIYLNKNPSFQRAYEAWDDKLKSRLIETILLGRAMNPIWTVLNQKEDSEEILDGMHRLSTALSYLNNDFCLNKIYFTSIDGDKYHNKKFLDLSADDRAKIRNYGFSFNKLDSSYRDDMNKLRDMYEILNRSSKALNDYEFNKVLYQPFYDCFVGDVKNDFLETKIFDTKNDSRGKIETEIIEIFVLSNEISASSWSSITSLKKDWEKKNLGETAESIQAYINLNKDKIISKLQLMVKFIKAFTEEGLFDEDKKLFKTNYLPYKFIIARCIFFIKNISQFNRHCLELTNKFKSEITSVDLSLKLDCNSRNATFQKKCIDKINDIILSVIKNDGPRYFPKYIITEKLKNQNYLCARCNNKLENNDFHADHIKSWTSGGETVIENCQILHKRCHQLKHST